MILGLCVQLQIMGLPPEVDIPLLWQRDILGCYDNLPCISMHLGSSKFCKGVYFALW
jgi:hypothetical protein